MSRTQTAQILSWGYDADIDVFCGSSSNNTVQQHATNLIMDIINHRQTNAEPSLKIIFVAFSMGGIVVKAAINQSAETAGNERKLLAPLTYGILFLGTPHRGSSTASLGEVAYGIRTAVTKMPNLNLLRALRKNSPMLQQISDAFSQNQSRFNIQIASFHEELETRKFLFFATTVRLQT